MLIPALSCIYSHTPFEELPLHVFNSNCNLYGIELASRVTCVQFNTLFALQEHPSQTPPVQGQVFIYPGRWMRGAAFDNLYKGMLWTTGSLWTNKFSIVIYLFVCLFLRAYCFHNLEIYFSSWISNLLWGAEIHWVESQWEINGE